MKELRYHHTALCRGYVRKGHGWQEKYSGKFGNGVKKHIPNCESRVSNNYHYVEYWIYGE